MWVHKYALNKQLRLNWITYLPSQAGIDGPTRDVQAGAKSAEALSKELMADSFEDWQQVYA